MLSTYIWHWVWMSWRPRLPPSCEQCRCKPQTQFCSLFVRRDCCPVLSRLCPHYDSTHDPENKSHCGFNLVMWRIWQKKYVSWWKTAHHNKMNCWPKKLLKYSSATFQERHLQNRHFDCTKLIWCKRSTLSLVIHILSCRIWPIFFVEASLPDYLLILRLLQCEV